MEPYRSSFEQDPCKQSGSVHSGPIPGFSLRRLHMGGEFVPPYGGRQGQGDKALMGGLMRGEHRLYGGVLTLIDYIN